MKKKLYSGMSEFQSVELVESGPFGKVSHGVPPAQPSHQLDSPLQRCPPPMGQGTNGGQIFACSAA